MGRYAIITVPTLTDITVTLYSSRQLSTITTSHIVSLILLLYLSTCRNHLNVLLKIAPLLVTSPMKFSSYSFLYRSWPHPYLPCIPCTSILRCVSFMWHWSAGTKQDLVRHYRGHTGDFPFMCIVDDCPFKASTKEGMEEHGRLCHPVVEEKLYRVSLYQQPPSLYLSLSLLIHMALISLRESWLRSVPS